MGDLSHKYISSTPIFKNQNFDIILNYKSLKNWKCLMIEQSYLSSKLKLLFHLSHISRSKVN